MIARELLPLPSIAEDIQGLFRRPRSLPAKLFYDETGSALFERITELPEYYLTRTETAILERSAADIAATMGPLATLVELGAGTSRKTRTLISALLPGSPEMSFFPVDLSIAPLRAGQIAIRREFPQLRQTAIVSDVVGDLSFLRSLPSPRLVLYLGSSIGNFDPMPAVALLTRLRQQLRKGDALLLGTDLRKSPELLIPAYDDAQGVTAAFNKNILARINRELGGAFDLETFRHRAEWNAAESRVEIYLESTVCQTVPIQLLDTTITFEAGERIHTENSYKYTDAMVTRILTNAGFSRIRSWTDERGWFGEHLARVES